MKLNFSDKKFKGFVASAWDLACIASLIGIWPRYIEPRLLSTTQLKIALPNLPESLHGLKILQFSDLHWHSAMSPVFLNKIIRKVTSLSPDIIVFTGDALCYGLLTDEESLNDFLCTFQAPYGCYAVLGNHDYKEYVSVDKQGDYNIGNGKKSAMTKGWKRLWTKSKLTGNIKPHVHQIPFQKQLIQCFKNSPFKLLHNETELISIKDSALNICGLGEYMLGRCLPEEAFKSYDVNFPGLILMHNPDGIKRIANYPGEIILCGHTHGGQVNIPGISHKFMYLENRKLKSGLFNIQGKYVYINRGIGSVMPFRWFSSPELLLITLENEKP